MRTINRAVIRSQTIAAAPALVHAYLSDGANLPAWAPGFASQVRPAGGTGWLVSRADLEFRIELLADARSATVDFVAAEDHARGLFARVLPSGEGSELIFAIMLAPDTPADAVAAQLLTLERELAAVRDACE